MNHSGTTDRRLRSRVSRGALLGAAALCALALAGCRSDMDVQPKYKPLDQSLFFDDGRASRPVIPDTVARGHLRSDELLYTGKVNGTLADTFPFAITRRDLERGRERYDIYCAPCHGRTGDGRGMIVERGFSAPPSYHIDRLRKAPAGQFYDAITGGFGKMYSYASRLSVEDRWRVVAYIRALQLSQSAALQDVPESARGELQEKASEAKASQEKATQEKAP